MTIAILSALPEEQQGLLQQLQQVGTTTRAGRQFHTGQWCGHDVVLSMTGIGKVAAATTTTTLAEHFGVQQLIFTGVAGGLGQGVQVGDIVVARQFVQHDMDARPLFPRWQVPGYAQPLFDCDAKFTALLHAAAQDCATQAAHWQLPILQGHAPRAHVGLIASGDQFIASAQTCAAIHDDLAQAGHPCLAVEMEGAAIAQVCTDYGIAFTAVRTISARADQNAHVDFPAFVGSVASRYALHIVQHYLQHTDLR